MQGVVTAGTASKLMFGWLKASGKTAENADEGILQNADDGGADEKNVPAVKGDDKAMEGWEDGSECGSQTSTAGIVS